MPHRTVVLAQLLPDTDLVQRGGEPRPGQCLGQHRCPPGDVLGRGEFAAIRGDDRLGPSTGEILDGGWADGLGEVVQRLHGQLVVGVRQP